MDVRKKTIVRLALVFGLLLLLSGCMCLPRGTHHESHKEAVEKKEAGETNGPPATQTTGEEERQKEISHDHGGAPAGGEKSHEHSGAGGHMGHMGVDFRSPWTWVIGGAMVVMMALML